MSTTLYWEEPLDYRNQDKNIGSLKYILAEYLQEGRNDIHGRILRKDDIKALIGMKCASTDSETVEDLNKLISAIEKFGEVTLQLY